MVSETYFTDREIKPQINKDICLGSRTDKFSFFLFVIFPMSNVAALQLS